MLFGTDLEIANVSVCIGFATSKVTPSKVERVAPSASENQTILTNSFYYINLFSDYFFNAHWSDLWKNVYLLPGQEYALLFAAQP